MKNNIQEITEKLEKGVVEVFNSERYRDYLSFMSKFYQYSPNNTLLIYLQMPTASRVAGYQAWKTKFNRQVREGEKSIKIIAPVPHKIINEEEEEEIAWTSFRVTSVFDISQTEGDEIPEIVNELNGDVKNFDSLYKKLEEVSPVRIVRENIDGGAKGFFSNTEKKIVIREGMSEAQTIKTMIHEISHAILHNKEDGEEKDAEREAKEVQAESVAFVVCNMLGIDTSDYSFGYVAVWSKNKDSKELQKSMKAIRDTSAKIIDSIKVA